MSEFQHVRNGGRAGDCDVFCALVEAIETEGASHSAIF